MAQKDQDKTSGSCCSLDFLRKNLGRNEAAVRRLVELFVETYPELRGRLESAAKNKDLHALQSAVHDIRGNCVLFSAHACLEQTRVIENALRKQNTDVTLGASEIDWAAECEKLGEMLATVEVELRACFAEVGSQQGQDNKG